MNALDHVSAHLKLKDNRGRERHPGGVQFRERDRLITALSQPIQQPLLLDIKDIHRDPIVALPRRWRAGPSGRPVARAAGTGLRSRSRCPCAPTIPPPPGRYGAQRHPRSSGGPQTPAAETPAGWPSHVVQSSARDPTLTVCRRVQCVRCSCATCRLRYGSAVATGRVTSWKPVRLVRCGLDGVARLHLGYTGWGVDHDRSRGGEAGRRSPDGYAMALGCRRGRGGDAPGCPSHAGRRGQRESRT